MQKYTNLCIKYQISDVTTEKSQTCRELPITHKEIERGFPPVNFTYCDTVILRDNNRF